MAIDVGTAVAYLNLDTTAFNIGLQQAQSAISAFNDKTATSADKTIALGSTLTNIGNTLTSRVTVPLVNLGSTAIQNARDFETAFAGVKKTIDDRRFKEFNLTWEDLEQGIKNIAYETGISAEEIAGVMEVAGQLGVELGEGGKGIIEFTRQMALMGVTTDLSSSEASLALARFMNITGVSNSEVGNLTASIVALGNNFATGEDEIITMSTRLASAGTMAGLTAQEILALSTAMTSAGIKAEAGASSMSTMLSQMTSRIVKYVQVMNGTFQGTEEEVCEIVYDMDVLARAANTSADNFAATWQKSPIEAIKMFIEGMARAEERGDNAILLLDDLGMSAIRESNMIRSLALSFENMADTIDTSNTAWQESSAMEEEASKRFETLDSRIGQLNERWKEMKREIAEVLIPLLETIMGYVERFINWWTSLDDTTQKIIIWIGLIAAALGPVVTFIGHLVTSWGLIKAFKVAKGVSEVVTEASKLEKVVNNFFSIGDIFANQIGGVNRGLERMTVEASGSAVELGNVGLKSVEATTGLTQTATAADVASTSSSVLLEFVKKLGGIGSILGGGFLMIKEFMDMWRDGFDGAKYALFLLGDALVVFGAFLLGFTSPIGIVIGVIVALVVGLVFALKENWDSIVDGLKNLWNTLKGWWLAIWEGLKFVVGKIGEFFANAWNAIKAGWAVIKLGAKAAWEVVKKVVKAPFEFIAGIVEWFVDKVVGFFKWLKYVLIGDPIVIDLMNGISGVFKAGFEFVLNIVKTILEAVVKVFEWLWEAAKKVVDGIMNVFEKGFHAILDFVSGVFEGIANFVNTAIEKIGGFLSNMVENILGWFSNLATNLGTVIGNIVGAFSDGFSRVKEAISNIFGGIRESFVSFRDKVVNVALEVGKGFIDAIKGGKESIEDFFKDYIGEAIKAIKDKIGDMKDAAKEFMGGFLDGLKSKWDSIIDWFKGLWDTIKNLWNNSLPGKIINTVGGAIGNLFNGSHADGLAYVPFDGYVAQLHQGERVLTAEENRRYSNGGSNGDTTINFYSNEKIDEYTAARELRRTVHDIKLGLV